jgi:hypothetical protein
MREAVRLLAASATILRLDRFIVLSDSGEMLSMNSQSFRR